MKKVSPYKFLTSMANGLNCRISHFSEKNIHKTISSDFLIEFDSSTSLKKPSRKKSLLQYHPTLKRENITLNNKSYTLEEVFIPIIFEEKKEGLLWQFITDENINSTNNLYSKIDSNLLEMIISLSDTFTALLNVEKTEELNSLYSQTSAFIGDRLSNALMLYDKNTNLIYINSAADTMNIAGIDLNLLTKNKALDILNKDFYYGNKLIGKVKYTNSPNITNNKFQLRNTHITSFNRIIGKNPQINKVMFIINQVATTDSTVLLRGESGTGKEEYAKLIHNLSHRKHKPFIALNCAAIPENLLESELFGYEGGSFTGAKKEGKMGKFELADTGTLFLDEIGDMPLSIQVKLLRVLQERYVEPVGGNKIIPIDVRILCATHRNLEDKIANGEFREDLFYRINVIPIDIPSLNSKHHDVELLLTYYVKKYCILQKKNFMSFSYDTIAFLRNYPWQGNIRELINVVEYCVTMSNKSIIDINDLPTYIQQFIPINKTLNSTVSSISTIDKQKKSKKPSREEFKELIKKFGKDTEGKKELAKHLNISLATLYRWISSNK
ncbi:sigma 54-interacting transcriptional regulator [Clostridium sediminicola]|uniref:sigma-54 interaction domain-containing protein n=1 Tax=Clostridium sediminicola TaxID=3114879 RepID=UPI0031F22DDB